MTQRTKIWLAAALVANSLMWNLPPAMAQTANSDLRTVPADALPVAPSRPPEPEWAVRCEQGAEPRRCAILQNLFIAETGQLQISVRIDTPAGPDSSRMQVRLPLNLFLPAGLSFQVDDHPVGQMAILTCSATACISGSNLSEELVNEMKAGGTLNLSYETADRSTVSVSVTLIGFTAAFEQL